MSRVPVWVIIALVLIATPLTACGDNRSQEQRIIDANLKIQNASFRSAIIEYRNVLRANPSNLEARLGLAYALQKVGDSVAAEKEIDRAIELDATPDQYLEILATSLAARGAHAELLAEVAVDQVKDPAMASVLDALRGRSMLALGSSDEAVQVFDRVLAQGQSVEAQRIALLGKANIASGKADFSTAERLARQSLEIAPDSAESFLTVGQLLVLQARYADAKAFLSDQNTANVKMSNMQRFRMLGERTQALTGLGDLDAADDAALAMSSIAPDHPMAGFLRGRVAFQRGDYDSALELLQSVGAKYPQFVPVQGVLGAVSLKRGEFEQAEVYLSTAVAAEPTNATARQLLAEARMRMRRPEEAAQTLRDGLLNDENNPRLLAMLGRANMQSGAADDGIEMLRKSLDADPGNAQAMIALAAAYVRQGKREEAVRLIEGLPAGALDESRRQILLVVARYDEANPGPAQEKLEELLAQSPDDPSILALAGSFYQVTKDYASARKQFERVLKAEPSNSNAQFAILRIDEIENDYTRSREIFNEIRQRDPRNVTALLVLARLAETDGDHDQAIAFAREAHAADETALMPNIILVGESLRRREVDDAENFARLAVTHHDDVAQAQAAMGMVMSERGLNNEAAPFFRRATQLEPNNYFYHARLARTQIATGKLAQARDSYRLALQNNPADLASLRSLAVLEVRAGNGAIADDLLRQARARYGDGPTMDELTGDVRNAQQNYAEALASFVAANEVAPSWPLTAKIFSMRQKTATPNPTEPLEQWLDDNPSHAPARLMLAQTFQRGGDENKAIQQYEMLIVDHPDSALALNNLAWLYFTQPGTENRVRALEIADRAHRLAPANYDIADTLGWIQFRSGQADAGVLTLREALAATTPKRSPDIAYHLAAALQETGATSEARETLIQALASTRRFSSRDDAQRLLDSL